MKNTRHIRKEKTNQERRAYFRNTIGADSTATVENIEPRRTATDYIDQDEPLAEITPTAPQPATSAFKKFFQDRWPEVLLLAALAWLAKESYGYNRELGELRESQIRLTDQLARIEEQIQRQIDDHARRIERTENAFLRPASP